MKHSKLLILLSVTSVLPLTGCGGNKNVSPTEPPDEDFKTITFGYYDNHFPKAKGEFVVVNNCGEEINAVVTNTYDVVSFIYYKDHTFEMTGALGDGSDYYFNLPLENVYSVSCYSPTPISGAGYLTVDCMKNGKKFYWRSDMTNIDEECKTSISKFDLRCDPSGSSHFSDIVITYKDK